MAKPRSQPQMRLTDAHVYDDAPGIDKNHWSRKFHQHIYLAFDDAEFADMYQERGRYPISPRFLACITILQYVFRVSDRTAVENTIMRRDWRVALGIDNTYDGFHPTVLTGFRKRLCDHDRERAIFEAVLDRLREHGLLQDRRKVRVDSTHLLADVSRRSRVDAIREAMRLVVCELGDAYPQLFDNVAFRTLYDEYSEAPWLGTRRDDDDVLTELACDAKTLLKLCEGRNVKAKEVLAQIIDENFTFDDNGEPDPNGSETPPKDRITTPHDPEARIGKKGDTVWLGNKLHIVETADANWPNFIVDLLVTDPSQGDSEATEQIAQRTAFRLRDVEAIIADGGYYTARNSQCVRQLGMELISPPQSEKAHSPVPASEFELDYDNQVATCPKGCKSVSWQVYKKGSREHIRIQFSRTDCRNCQLWGQCVPKGKNGRRLDLSIHNERLSEDRKNRHQPWFGQLYRCRPAIEATISELVRTCGARRSRYPGAQGRTLHAIFAATALNVKRALAYLGEANATCGATPPPVAVAQSSLASETEAIAA